MTATTQTPVNTHTVDIRQRLTDAYAGWAEARGTHGEMWLDIFDDQVEMRSVLNAQLPVELARTHTSKGDVPAYFAAIASDWEMLHYTVDRIVADGDEAVMVGHMGWRNRATGQVLESAKVDVWRFRDGRAVSFLEMYDSLGFAKASGLL